MATNYRHTFITVSPDSPVLEAKREPRPGTVAALQLGLLLDAPYALTSDDLLYEVHTVRSDAAAAERPQQRGVFDAKSKACLRASSLVKTHSWGLQAVSLQLRLRTLHTPSSQPIRSSRWSPACAMGGLRRIDPRLARRLGPTASATLATA